jgi:hypothetical protein
MAKKFNNGHDPILSSETLERDIAAVVYRVRNSADSLNEATTYIVTRRARSSGLRPLQSISYYFRLLFCSMDQLAARIPAPEPPRE